jgi:hypothetical protein
LGRSNIAVSDEIALRLSEIAEREGKTAYALANECLDEALKVCEKGGRPNEIYGAWIMNHIGKDIVAFQWIGKNLMEQMIADFGRVDPPKFKKMWYDAGYNFGVYLQMCFPTIENLAELVMQLRQSFNIGRVELVEGNEEGRTYTLTVFSSYSAEMLSHISEFYRGIFSAYGLSIVDSKIVTGVIRLRFMSPGKLMKAEAHILA